MTNPFDYVKSINDKTHMEHTALYNPVLSNIAFSYSLDTVLLANEMNQYSNLPPDMQYDFMYHTVKKGKRFNKWYKQEENPHLELVMQHYGYSKEKALEALQVLTQSDIRALIEHNNKGGN